MRKILVLLGALVLVVTGGTSAQAAPPEDNFEARVVFTGDVHIPEGEIAGSVVAFDGDVDIDGHVHGSVVAFNGSVDVRGTVTGSVLAFAGPVNVQGEVYDDVWATDAPVVIDDGRIGGTYGRWSPEGFGEVAGLLSRLGFWFAGSVSTLILGIFLLLFAPRALDAFARVGRGDTGRAIGIGMIVFFGLPLAAIAAFASIVGIPLGLWISLALLAVYAIGYTVSAFLLGTAIRQDRVTSFFVGWLIARLVAIIPVLGGIVWLAAAIFGLGVIGVAIWRARLPVASPAVPAAS